jgi:hypothetical protein
MKDEASYICDSCVEEMVVPIDLSAGTSQEYVESSQPLQGSSLTLISQWGAPRCIQARSMRATRSP